jgi:hypothetical protein
MAVPVDRKSFLALPPPSGCLVALQVCPDLFPRVEWFLVPVLVHGKPS